MSLVSRAAQLTRYSLCCGRQAESNREVGGCLLKDKANFFSKDRSRIPTSASVAGLVLGKRHAACWVSLTSSSLQRRAAAEHRQVKL